jgi:hypothetical protein
MMAAVKDEAGRAGRWQPRLTFPVLLLIGRALYEATAQPGLAAAITSPKFGWADLLAARWRRRVDPDRGGARRAFGSTLRSAFVGLRS